jgi:hypothetical protein
MSRSYLVAAIIGTTVTLLGACGDERTGQSPGDSVEASDSPVVGRDAPVSPTEPTSAVDTIDRPATRTDTMMLEADPHVFEARRLDAGLYSVYYPADEMIVEQGASDEGEGVRFIANFGGTRTDSAFLHIFTPNDPASGLDDVRRLLLEPKGIIGSHGWRAEEMTPARYPWAIESFRITGRAGSDIIGSASIGEHRGRGIVVVTAYPAEFAEGMGPRVASILASLEWKDTRTGLARERTTTRPRRRVDERNQRLHL